MKRTILVQLALIALMTPIATAALAAQPAGQSQPDPQAEAPDEASADLPEPVIPERQLTFEISEQPHVMGVPAGVAADLKAAGPRYVGIVRLAVPHVDARVLSYPLRVDGIVASRFRGELFSVWPADLHDAIQDPNWLQSLVAKMPQERRPAKDVTEELARSLSLKAFGRESWMGDSGARQPEPPVPLDAYDFQLRADSVDRVKQLAEQFLAILDYGISYPNQLACSRYEQGHEQHIIELRAAGQKAEERIPELEPELKGLDEFQDLDGEAIARLATQLRLIAVDNAGVEARIAACDGILKRLGLDSDSLSRREQVETIKIAAEIELVGLTAKKQAIEALVEKGERRTTVQQELKTARDDISRAKAQIPTAETRIARFEAARQANMPFEVRGKIMIHPIQWVVGK